MTAAPRDLEGKVALVTGGSRGIGRAISLALARRGANVVVVYLRKRGAADDACAEIEQHGVKAAALRCNVGDESQLDSAFAQLDEMFGRLDIFISNAATGVIRPVYELGAREWDWTMNANARALLLGARRARELMHDGGSIVALSSQGAGRVLPGYAAVGASKAAVESLVRYLAVELAPSIRANVVSPGVVDTEALLHFPMREAMLDKAGSTTPAGRLATPEDVAKTVGFLVSDEAAMITGQIVVVDGGAGIVA